MNKKVLTPLEFCNVYGLGRTSLYAELKAGRIASYKQGRSRRIAVEAAEAWHRRQQQMGATAARAEVVS